MNECHRGHGSQEIIYFVVVNEVLQLDLGGAVGHRAEARCHTPALSSVQALFCSACEEKLLGSQCSASDL